MRTLLVSSKLLLAFAVFANANPRHPMPPHKMAARDACLKKLDLTDDQLREGMDNGEGEKDRGCFMACMDKELGLMTADGDIDRDAAIKDFPPFFPPENRTKIVDTCSEQKGGDDCETAKLYHDCVEKLKPRPPMRPELKKVHDSCKEKLNLSDGEIEKIVQEMDETKKDCYLACFGKGLGHMNEDGSFNKTVFIGMAPPHMREEIQKIVDICLKEEGADECETAVLLMNCFKKNHLMMMEHFGPPHPPPPNHGE